VVLGGHLACLTVFLCILPSSLFAAQAAAQTGADRLASVEVTGSSKFHSDQIVAATGLHAGMQVTRDDLQRAADFLVQLGLFSNVQYRYASVEAGVTAQYHVIDAPTVPVLFDNFPWFTDDELAAAIKASVVLFDGAAPEHGKILDQMSDAIAKLLVSHGVNLSVSHALTTNVGGDAHVQLFHAEDSGVTVAGVEFSDGLAQGERGIQTRLADIVGAPYSRAAFELFEFEQVRPVYLSHAFAYVKFGRPSVRFTGTGNSRVTIIAPIDAGPAYAWNGVTWSGNSAAPSSELDKLVTLRTGDPADGMKMEAMWQSVRDAYRQRGYLDVNFNPTPHRDEFAKRVTYAVSITEGPQYRMGKLVLTGLSIEGERRIRAAWTIPTGALFNASVYEEFLSDGVKQAFSGLPFHYEKIGRFLQEDAKAGTVDVMLDFQ
jgi:outer membrane protein assembly factor BamA